MIRQGVSMDLSEIFRMLASFEYVCFAALHSAKTLDSENCLAYLYFYILAGLH